MSLLRECFDTPNCTAVLLHNTAVAGRALAITQASAQRCCKVHSGFCLSDSQPTADSLLWQVGHYWSVTFSRVDTATGGTEAGAPRVAADVSEGL